MIQGLFAGLKAVSRSWGLLGLLLAVNLTLPLFLAIPLARVLEHDLDHRDAASRMMYGFDFGWWGHWSSNQSGYLATFRPEIFGSGFVPRNWELVIKGKLPVGSQEDGLDAVILALGVLYLLVQNFLLGGILAIFRAPQGSWSLRGLLHGSGFYFGRFARLWLVTLLIDALWFLANRPIHHFVERRAQEAVSETTGLAFVFGHQALIALGILMVHMISCYARVITVLEERTSALLALVSSASFCLSRPFRTVGHYALVALLGLLLLAVWSSLDPGLTVTGYKTQLAAFVLGQGLILGRLALRLSLFGGQMEIYRLAP